MSRFPALRAGIFLAISTSLATPLISQQHARSASEKPEVKNIFWQPNEVKQGSPVLISVEVSGAARDVTGSWLGKRIRFSPSEKPHTWIALAGPDLDQKPGSFDLQIRAVVRGHIVHGAKQIDVQEAQFGTGDVNVAQDYVHPTPDEQRQIAHDDLLKKHAFAIRTPRRLWNGNFVKPVDAEATPSFGETRTMNEDKTSRHMGTDFPVKEDTPVFSSNAGIVVLATKLFYEGDCIIIDHGDRLFTVYMHLEKLKVHRGEHVRKHAEIGLSGRTGRVTGPHLHLEVVWNDNHLDPVQLLALTLPEREVHEAHRRAR